MKISAWAALALYLMVMSSFISGKHREVNCNSIVINITDSLQRQFIVSEDIEATLLSQDYAVLGKKLKTVNTKRAEEIILQNSLVKQCRAYTTVDGKLNVELSQKQPVIRLIDKNRKSVYVDIEGNLFEPSVRFSPLLVVATGNFRIPKFIGGEVNILQVEDSLAWESIRNVFTLGSFISQNEFWNAQIEQIYINKKREIELVPRIGPHLIKFGTIEDYEEKLYKLKLLYDEGLNRVGWNQYLFIDLRFKDQIVCTRN